MKKVAFIIAAIMLIVSVTACGEGGGSQSVGSGAASNPSVASTPVGSGDGQSSAKDSLVIAINVDPQSFDQFVVASMLENQISANIYDNLLFFDEDGTPQPALAESYEISQDGLVYTFHLRKGVKFHNGEELKADDVVFTFEYGRRSPNHADMVSLIETIEAVDDYTVKMTCNSLSAPFFTRICGDQFPIYNRKAVEAVETYGAEPVGTGAYKYVSHDAGAKVEFEANEEYFRGAPAIKKLTYRILPDTFTAGVALESGDVDLIWVCDATTAATLKDNPDLVVEPSPNIRVNYLVLNTEQPPFDNRLVRQAVNYAIDRETIQEVVDEGMSNIKDDMAMPWMNGYAEASVRYNFDLEKAKSLMAEAGYSLDKPVDVSIHCVVTTQKTAQVVQECLSAIGLNVTINMLEFNTYQADMRGGQFDIGVGGFFMIYRDMDIMNMFYGSSMIDIINYARYNSPEADALIREGKSTLDLAKRVETYKKLMDTVQEDAPYVILSNPLSIRPYHKDLNIANVYANNVYVRDISWK